MDGNGRWARQRGLPSLSGHKQGVERVRGIMEACKDAGIEVLTLFAFSSENWKRPGKEVSGLMSLFSTYLKKETAKLKDEGIRLRVIGSREKLPAQLVKLIEYAETETAGGEMSLVLAVDYGGRWDIAQASKRIAEKVSAGELAPEDINEAQISDHLCIAELPEPDLLIRTSGELRISNFLLWQCAYTEFYFTDVYWPDFDEQVLGEAIEDYYSRQRRYGLTVEQVEQQEGHQEKAIAGENTGDA
jgi:undecaprenyl diphosphate synthase